MDRAEEGLVPGLGVLGRQPGAAPARRPERGLRRHGDARRLAFLDGRVEPAEDRPDALEAVVLERRRRFRAQNSRALRAAVVAREVAPRPVDALRLHVPALRADREDLVDVAARLTGRVTPEGLEAGR